jgi:ADP-ribose pyrophosphatase YjhB (NUDIX family)
MTDPLFEKVYNETVVKSLEKRFGPLQRQHVEMTVATDMMLRMVDKMNDKPRRGEVVMVVPADRAGAESQVWVHTKAFYPEGIYRLMTGGLELNEVPPQALLREVEEETGFKTKIDRCLAAITYTFM